MPLPKDSPFDIRLSSGREARSYGLILERSSLQVQAVAQDDSVYVRNVGKKPGDFDEQRSWKQGRGHEKLSDNAEGYWDGTAWTMTKGHVHNGLLWRFASGFRKATSNFSSSKGWGTLAGAQLGFSVSFTPEETGNYTAIMLWVRWRGSSVATNTLTVKLHSDNSGSPGTVLQTATKSVSDASDGVSKLLRFAITSTALTAGTTYHITVAGASTSNKANHWQVAVDTSGSSSKISADLSAWSAPSSTFSLLYRITDANVGKRFYAFFLDGHMYVVDSKYDKSTASQLYINGDRGKATSATASTLTDTNNGVRSTAWTTNMWAGARIRIVRGPGVGQKRTIASNTGTVITVTEDFDQTPTNASEYVIYSTLVFQELTTTGLGVVTGEPAVMNNIVYFPQGTGTAIRDMALDYTVATNHKYRSEARAGSEYANFLLTANDKTGTLMWRVLNTTVSVSSAPLVAYATDLTFGTAITCGDLSYLITGINKKDSILQVFKENGNGAVVGNVYVPFDSGQDDSPDDANGAASLAIDKFIYYSWLHSMVRIYGSSYDDVGQDFSGKGLPAGREGVFSSLDAYITTVLCAVNAGTAGTSSVLMFDGLSYHELFRHPFVGYRISMVKVQPNPEGRNIVWMDFGGNDLVMVAMPLQKKDPLLDSGVLYQHESIIESSIIDMGAASDLPKFIKSLTATVKNLNSNGREVYLDYQVDEACGGTSWTPASVMTQSPESTVWLGLNNIRRFAYRLRLNTNSATTPVDIEGIVPNGYARTPLKLMWTMRIKAGGIYQSGSQTAANSSKLFKWLLDNARLPYAILMESKYEIADGFHCIIHPPRATPFKPAEPGQPEEMYMSLTLEEI